MEIESNCVYALSEKAQNNFRLLVGISVRITVVPFYVALILVVSAMSGRLDSSSRTVIAIVAVVAIVLFHPVESAISRWRLNRHILAVYVAVDRSLISFVTLAEMPILIHFDARDVKFRVIRSSAGYRRRIGKIKFFIRGHDTMNVLVENVPRSEVENAVLLLRDILTEIPTGRKRDDATPT